MVFDIAQLQLLVDESRIDQKKHAPAWPFSGVPLRGAGDRWTALLPRSHLCPPEPLPEDTPPPHTSVSKGARDAAGGGAPGWLRGLEVAIRRGSRRRHAMKPPSMVRLAPLMYVDSGRAR